MLDIKDFMDALGYLEEPMGIFYSDEKPAQGFTPKPSDLPTAEKEAQGQVDWGAVFGNFSCTLGKIYLARKKRCAAYFDANHFGCVGGAFYLGFMKPQTSTVVHYVSSGVPGVMEGEHYVDSPDNCREYFQFMDPPPAPARYCVVKPLSQFKDDEEPLLVSFFARPEVISGLHQLAFFITNDPEAVMSPFGAGCANLITWPLKYMSQGKSKAVLGGWDPSCRKFLNTDEVSFSLPWQMFQEMNSRWSESFLTTPVWQGVKKKIARSRKTWGGK